jgi:lipoyl(octanoyl) transferase
MESFTPATWRLIQTPPARGAWNMAVDEAILDAVRRAEAPPTLRLYAWEPPCFSLGYAQSVKDVDRAALAERGWDLVRRPTGGRAILHTDELTYSVIGPPEDERLAGSVLESYRCLSSALLQALHLLGIPAEAHEKSLLDGNSPTLAERENPICFEVPSNYEITVDGKKLIGSAQARRRDGVLQHGSLPLYGDLRRIADVLVFPTQEERAQAGQRLLMRAATVEYILGALVSWERAAKSFILAFQESLNLHLEPGSLSAVELTRADALVVEKYAHPKWTERI